MLTMGLLNMDSVAPTPLATLPDWLLFAVGLVDDVIVVIF